MSFINEHRDRFGVEPICDTMQVAPSTYYAALSRPPSARQLRDGKLKVDIARVHQENFDVYGTEKVWKQLRREDIEVGRDRVGRLMAELELVGAVRGKTWRTTIPSSVTSRPADLVDRDFNATAPNRLWVADLTYVSTWPGVVYTAFVTDVFSRYIVGWKVSTTLRAELALDALEMAIWSRGTTDLKGSTWPFAIPNGWPTRERSARSGRAAIPMTTRWPSPSSASTRPSSSASKVRGAHSSSSSWPRPAGSSGTTSAGSTALSGMCHQQSSSRPTISSARRQPLRENQTGKSPRNSGRFTEADSNSQHRPVSIRNRPSRSSRRAKCRTCSGPGIRTVKVRTLTARNRMARD